MHNDAKKILEVISQNGGEARIVGGYVRDKIIGIESSDIDISTTLLPDEVLNIFSALDGYKAIPTGVEFGTVTVVYNKNNFEITSLREDIECDGRHAKVTFTQDFMKDAARRDFTFNALYMDAAGKIYDYFEGQEDLSKGLVRFIGDAKSRIEEDYLRILRMFRFHAKYGKGDIDRGQLRACSALKDGLENVSGERINQEVMKIFSYRDNENAVESMIHSGVMSSIFGVDVEGEDFAKIALLGELYSPVEEGQGDGSVSCENYEVSASIHNPITYLAVLLSKYLNEENYLDISSRLRFSKKDRQLLLRLIKSTSYDFLDEYQLRKMVRINGKQEVVEYLRLVCCLRKIDKDQYISLREGVDGMEVMELPISAQDLISKGVAPGKKIGVLLNRATEIWERSAYEVSKEELLMKLDLL